MSAPSTININLNLSSRASAALSEKGDVPTKFFEAGANLPESSSPGGKNFSRAARISFCRMQQAAYRASGWPASRVYRLLNAGFYLQLKRGIART
jgi:hypothetical protein